jgi:hypothetical protein
MKPARCLILAAGVVLVLGALILAPAVLAASAGPAESEAPPAYEKTGADPIVKSLMLAVILGATALGYRRLERAPWPPLSAVGTFFLTLLVIGYVPVLAFTMLAAPFVVNFDLAGPGLLGRGAAVWLTGLPLVIPLLVAIRLRRRPRLLRIWCLSALLGMPAAFLIPFFNPGLPRLLAGPPELITGLRMMWTAFFLFPLMGFIAGPTAGLLFAWWSARRWKRAELKKPPVEGVHS